MSSISLDPVMLKVSMERVQPLIEALYASLRGIPDVDGGIASNMIGVVASAGAEASQVVADAHVALFALATEAVNQIGASEESVATEMRDFEQFIEGR